MKTSKALTQFMRQLRPYLEGKVEKLKSKYSLGWIVDGSVVIKVEYVCRTDSVEKCVPHSVKVYVASVHDHWSYKGKKTYENYTEVGFRCRTFRRRQDDTINLESISIAVRSAKEAYTFYEATKKKKEEDSVIRKKNREATQKLLERKCPKKGRTSKAEYYHKQGFDYKRKEDDVLLEVRTFSTGADVQPYSKIEIENIKDPALAIEIVKAIHKILF